MFCVWAVFVYWGVLIPFLNPPNNCNNPSNNNPPSRQCIQTPTWHWTLEWGTKNLKFQERKIFLLYHTEASSDPLFSQKHDLKSYSALQLPLLITSVMSFWKWKCKLLYVTIGSLCQKILGKKSIYTHISTLVKT